jgi:hypothetical protein
MRPDTFSYDPTSRIVKRHTRHYPKGIFAARLRAGHDPQGYIARCIECDKESRLGKVMAYLEDRKARPAPVPATDQNQLNLF